MLQIGTEGGFLPAPVVLSQNTPFVLNDDGSFTYNLLVAPAELPISSLTSRTL